MLKARAQRYFRYNRWRCLCVSGPWFPAHVCARLDLAYARPRVLFQLTCFRTKTNSKCQRPSRTHAPHMFFNPSLVHIKEKKDHAAETSVEEYTNNLHASVDLHCKDSVITDVALLPCSSIARVHRKRLFSPPRSPRRTRDHPRTPCAREHSSFS